MQQQQLTTRSDITEASACVQVSSHRQLNTGALCLLINQVLHNTLRQAIIGALSPRQHLVVIATHRCTNNVLTVTSARPF